MRTRKHPLTPLAAVAAGLLAGAVGTVCLDAVHYLKYRREGGTESPLAWEFAPVSTWETAPDPGQVAKRLIEGFTQSKLPDRSAWPISTAAHWAFGSANAAVYGVVAGSARRPHPAYGVPFGAAVWASGYAVLPEAGLYKPILEYDAKTLAWDLSAHLAYGAGTGATFWVLARLIGAGTAARLPAEATACPAWTSHVPGRYARPSGDVMIRADIAGHVACGLRGKDDHLLP